jgi:hypothetical protein
MKRKLSAAILVFAGLFFNHQLRNNSGINIIRSNKQNG